MQNVGSKARRKTRFASVLCVRVHSRKTFHAHRDIDTHRQIIFIYIYIYIYLYMYRYENKVYMYNQIVSWERFALPFDFGIDSWMISFFNV